MSTVLAAYAIVGGVASLLGWAFDVPQLTDWVGNGISIQPNATICVVLAGLGVLSLAGGGHRLAAACGGVVALIAGLTAIQYLVNADFGIDTLLMFDRPWGRVGTIRPGRMGPPGTASWLCVGTALVLAGLRRRVAVAQAVAGIAAGISTVSILGYAYRADVLFTVPRVTVIAFQTATFILAVSVGLIMAASDRGLPHLIRRRDAAGILIRRVALPIVLVPVVLGLLRLRGQRAGLYDTEFGVALQVFSTILFLGGLLWWTAKTIAASEDVRLDALESLQIHERQLAKELHATRRVQEVSTRLLQTQRLESILQEILAASCDILETTKGNIQLLDAASGELKIIVHQGLGTPFLEYFAQQGWQAGCDAAMERRERVLIPDVTAITAARDRKGLQVLLGEGIRGFVSTPLVARDGALIGMVSNHFTVVHRPSEVDLHHLDVLARLTADFIERIRAEDALREADRRKDEFLAVLAHELRNPLGAIRNAAGLLRHAGGAGSAGQPVHDILDRQLNQLVRLVDDLLEVSRLTRGQIELRKQRLDLRSAMASATEMVRDLVDAGRLQLDLSLPGEPIEVDGDSIRLAQVFSNLLNNACKYSSPGGKIRLSLQRDGSDVVISVEDTGVGIPTSMVDRIFELFTQVDDSLERRVGGLGVGLYIVKRLVELHGGSVHATSGGPGRGTRFTVRLPALPASRDQAVTDAAVAAVQPVLQKRRILVVDDNEDALWTLSMLLTTSGHEVATAQDGLEALEKAQSWSPDTVLLDVGLPKLNGYDTCRAIRQLEHGTSMRIFAVTGWGQARDQSRAFAAGFDEHVVKPVDFPKLLRMLDGEPPRTSGEPAR